MNKQIAKLIEEETGNKLNLKRVCEGGFVVHNNSHHKDNLIRITTDPDEMKSLLKKGWARYPGVNKYIFQAPEIVLCDLTEIKQNPTDDVVEILTLFSILKEKNLQSFLDRIAKSMHNGPELIHLNGCSANLEIRIAGTDQRIKSIPQIIFKSLKATRLWKKKMTSFSVSAKRRSICYYEKDVSKCSYRTRSFFRKVSREYSDLGVGVIPRLVVGGFWKDLPEADIYVFMPKSGIKYALGFIEETKMTERVVLWEYHHGLSYEKELVLFNRRFENKKVCIIDRSYSGNTLEYVHNKIVEAGGLSRKVAVFPKSKKSIKSSDYSIILDRVINNQSIQLEDERWNYSMMSKILNQVMEV